MNRSVFTRNYRIEEQDAILERHTPVNIPDKEDTITEELKIRSIETGENRFLWYEDGVLSYIEVGGTLGLPDKKGGYERALHIQTMPKEELPKGLWKLITEKKFKLKT